MPPEFDARTKELISRMWGKKVWVVLSKGSGANIAPHLAEHLDYLDRTRSRRQDLRLRAR